MTHALKIGLLTILLSACGNAQQAVTAEALPVTALDQLFKSYQEKVAAPQFQAATVAVAAMSLQQVFGRHLPAKDSLISFGDVRIQLRSTSLAAAQKTLRSLDADHKNLGQLWREAGFTPSAPVSGAQMLAGFKVLKKLQEVKPSGEEAGQLTCAERGAALATSFVLLSAHFNDRDSAGSGFNLLSAGATPRPLNWQNAASAPPAEIDSGVNCIPGVPGCTALQAAAELAIAKVGGDIANAKAKKVDLQIQNIDLANARNTLPEHMPPCDDKLAGQDRRHNYHIDVTLRTRWTCLKDGDHKFNWVLDNPPVAPSGG